MSTFYQLKAKSHDVSNKSNRRSKQRDPHHAREARKYDNPIPSREFILETLTELGVPMDMHGIAAQLELKEDEQLEALRRRLLAMERDG